MKKLLIALLIPLLAACTINVNINPDKDKTDKKENSLTRFLRNG